MPSENSDEGLDGVLHGFINRIILKMNQLLTWLKWSKEGILKGAFRAKSARGGAGNLRSSRKNCTGKKNQKAGNQNEIMVAA